MPVIILCPKNISAKVTEGLLRKVTKAQAYISKGCMYTSLGFFPNEY